MKKLSVIAIGTSVLLAACGGGGSSSSSSDVTPVAETITITPSLGKFKKANVVMKKANGNKISEATIGDDGTAKLAIDKTYTDAVIIEVEGGPGVQYFDEELENYRDYPTGEKIRAVLPKAQSAGVTPLTDAAVEWLENHSDGNKLTTGSVTAIAEAINEANTKMGAQFGLTDILLPPNPIGAVAKADKSDALDIAKPADKYALILAAIAKNAEINPVTQKKYTAAQVGKALAKDMTDGILDGQTRSGKVTKSIQEVLSFTPFIPKTFTDNYAKAIEDAGKKFFTTESTELAKLTIPKILDDITSIIAKPIEVQSDISLAKAMFSELRTTLKSFSNKNKTGLLDTATKRAQEDFESTRSTGDLAGDLIGYAYQAVKAYEDGKAYTNATTKGFALMQNPFGPGQVLGRGEGHPIFAANGMARYSGCILDGTTGLTSKVTCASSITAERKVNAGVATVVYLVAELTLKPGTTDQYNYKASRYTQAVTLPGTLPSNYSFAIQSTPVVEGAGTISKSYFGTCPTATVGNPYPSCVSKVTMTGTLPPSSSATTLDTVDLSGEKTAKATANHFKYLISGKLSTAMSSDATKTSAISLDAGSYIEVDETNVAAQGQSEPLGMSLVGSIQSKLTKFTGTLVGSEPLADKNGKDKAFTKFVFNGSIADLTSGGYGEYLLGTLDFKQNKRNTDYDSTQKESISNPGLATLTLNGTIKLPNRPELKLVLADVKNGHTAQSTSLKYSYTTNGKAVEFNGSGTTDSANPANDTSKISNQDNIEVDTKSGLITKSAKTLGALKGEFITYEDGVKETAF